MSESASLSRSNTYVNQALYTGTYLGHIQNVSESSVSLALLSTLIFSLSISILLDFGGINSGATWANLEIIVVSFGAMNCTYTLTYSVLEYYYGHLVLGAESRLQHEVMLEKGLKSPRDVRSLQQKATEVFESFTVQRAWARNAMWDSVMSLMWGAAIKINHSNIPEMSPAATVGVAFVLLCSTAVSMILIQIYLRTSIWTMRELYIVIALGLIRGFIAAGCVPRGKSLPPMVAAVFLIAGILSLIPTVVEWRQAIKPILAEFRALH